MPQRHRDAITAEPGLIVLKPREIAKSEAWHDFKLLFEKEISGQYAVAVMKDALNLSISVLVNDANVFVQYIGEDANHPRK